MYLFQIFVNRVLTPEKGQEMLDKMFANVQAGAAGYKTVKLPGENTHENPFPQWIQEALKKIPELVYDEMNFCFQRKFTTREKAQAMMGWFDSTLRPWIQGEAAKLHPESVPVVESLHVRVMDHSDEVGDADTF